MWSVIRVWALALCFPLLLGCESQHDGMRGPRPDGAGASPPPPPDAGTATGHGIDARRVIVPEHDASPPTATIVLVDPGEGRTLAQASRPGHPPSGELELREARLRGTTIGEDLDGGIVRVRVSVFERITCRSAEGARFERLRTRYFPPPQTEQIRAAPGARLATRSVRSRPVVLASERCGAQAEATGIDGRLWGEVINGHGLETITPMIRFRYRP